MNESLVVKIITTKEEKDTMLVQQVRMRFSRWGRRGMKSAPAVRGEDKMCENFILCRGNVSRFSRLAAWVERGTKSSTEQQQQCFTGGCIEVGTYDAMLAGNGRGGQARMTCGTANARYVCHVFFVLGFRECDVALKTRKVCGINAKQMEII